MLLKYSGKYLIMNHIIFRLVFFFLILFQPIIFSQNTAIKNNLVYSGYTIPNASLEFNIKNNKSLSISGTYRPFQFDENQKFKLWSVQPELRFWPCRTFFGHFWGINALAGQFNVGGYSKFSGIDITKLDISDYRVEATHAGLGFTYGYHAIITKRLGFEFTFSAGYSRIWYEKFYCIKCGEKIDEGVRNYFGPTNAGLSLVYLIN